ncbi:MAG: topoisomerase IV, partial [Ruminiclostridium sp.]|nr:topoisomerase IV [Ruminiclostridium sp.]
GYFKRITAQSLRMSGEQKLKEGDEVIFEQELSGKTDLLFFTDKHQVYKSAVADFADTKASMMGDYVPAKLEMEQDEKIIKMIPTEDYSGNIILFFKNGKCAKVPLSSFETKTKRKKLANAYFDGSDLVAMYLLPEDRDFILQSAAGKVLIFSSALVLPKAARDTQGVQVMRLTRTELQSARPYEEGMLDDPERFVAKSVPVAGTAADISIDQITFE